MVVQGSALRKLCSQGYAGPGLGSGAGVCPYFLPFASPEMRGMARRRGACPGLLRGGPIVSRASPDRRALALMTRAPAPLGAPPRHRSAFAFTAAGPAGGRITPMEAARRPPGYVVA